MRKAGQASGRAYTDAMRQAWMKERDLATYLDYQFRTRGCDSSAYIPVVAGGQVRFILSWFMAVPLTVLERQYHSLHPERSSPKVSLQIPNDPSLTLILVQRWPNGASRRRWSRLLYFDRLIAISLTPLTGIWRLYNRHHTHMAHFRHLHCCPKRPL